MNLLVNRINSALFNYNDSNKTGDVKLIQSQLNSNGWDIYGKAVKTLTKIWEEQKADVILFFRVEACKVWDSMSNNHRF